MEVTFTRTGARRYAVEATRPGHPTVVMDPAPGFDPHLPHDLIHFVVESELGLELGVYGQLAEGGDAGSFYLPPSQDGSRTRTREQRRTKRKGSALARRGRADGELSEQAASLCHFEWLRRSPRPELRAEAAAMAPYARRLRETVPDNELARLQGSTLDRICARLDRLSERWRALGEGESLALAWK